jgi:hypothetical protein
MDIFSSPICCGDGLEDPVPSDDPFIVSFVEKCGVAEEGRIVAEALTPWRLFNLEKKMRE